MKSGKTALANRLASDEFKRDSKPTIGADFLVSSLPGRSHLEIWDCSGDAQYRAFSLTYTRNSSIVLFVVNPSVDDNEDWRVEFVRLLDDCVYIFKKDKNTRERIMKAVFVCTHSENEYHHMDDLHEMVQKYTNEMNQDKPIEVFHVSSSTGCGVDNLLFRCLSFDGVDEGDKDTKNNHIDVDAEEQKDSRGTGMGCEIM
jgi:GTPase SAR1 family protein